jgi:hypothetical protein
MSIQKISSWLLILLMALSAASALYFYGVGFDDKNPQNADQFLNWTYLLLFSGAGIALLLSVYNFVRNLIAEPKKALRSLGGIVAIVAIIVISYALSDGTPLKIVGYEGSDNVPSMLMFADTILYTMYSLAVIAILLVVVSSVTKMFR